MEYDVERDRSLNLPPFDPFGDPWHQQTAEEYNKNRKKVSIKFVFTDGSDIEFVNVYDDSIETTDDGYLKMWHVSGSTSMVRLDTVKYYTIERGEDNE